MRPYLSFSIDQLEAEFARARAANEKTTLRKLAAELKNRKSQRARKLRETIKAELGPTKPRQERNSEGVRSRQTHNRGANSSGTKQSNFRPTDEQEQALEFFRSNGSLKINAYAGSGKTSTLRLLANATSRRGQYIAFNKSIVTDASDKFPDTVNCATTHSLAFKATIPRFGGTEKLLGRINANQLADVLSFKRWRLDEKHTLLPRSQGYLVLETIRKFAQSEDPEPALAHVPQHGSLVAAPAEAINAVKEFALKNAKQVWERMQSPNDQIPLGHDGYLKLWALSNPAIMADYILMDEAQDTNPVVLGILKNQKAQMIYVGDKYQQIYEWRGAVNAMESIGTDYEAKLTQSFRFGEVLAAAASFILRLLGEEDRMKGNPAITTSISDSSGGTTILARTNAATIGSVIEALDNDKRPHLAGGNKELMAMLKGVQELKEGQPSVVPDFFGFTNWQEVVEFAKSGEGSHLQTFVNLVEARGERQLMWALNRTVAEENADVVISTAHKAKGQEWASVRLLDDFLKSRANGNSKGSGNGDSSSDPGYEDSELRLFYVALTRAKTTLSLPSNYHSLVGLVPL